MGLISSLGALIKFYSTFNVCKVYLETREPVTCFHLRYMLSRASMSRYEKMSSSKGQILFERLNWFPLELAYHDNVEF